MKKKRNCATKQLRSYDKRVQLFDKNFFLLFTMIYDQNLSAATFQKSVLFIDEFACRDNAAGMCRALMRWRKLCKYGDEAIL